MRRNLIIKERSYISLMSMEFRLIEERLSIGDNINWEVVLK